MAEGSGSASSSNDFAGEIGIDMAFPKDLVGVDGPADSFDAGLSRRWAKRCESFDGVSNTAPELFDSPIKRLRLGLDTREASGEYAVKR
jgi:hypothetical protein